jgi:DNA-binding transcriptional ArsR family regulator
VNEVFKALADPTRREILRVLRGGERTAGELAELFPLTKSTLSGHFNVLKGADLVDSEKRGTTVIYRLNTTVFQEVLTGLMDLFGKRSGRPRARGGTRMTPFLRREWPSLLALAANLAFALWALPRLPERYPAHYNLAGEVDRYGTPTEALLWPGLALASTSSSCSCHASIRAPGATSPSSRRPGSRRASPALGGGRGGGERPRLGRVAPAARVGRARASPSPSSAT